MGITTAPLGSTYSSTVSGYMDLYGSHGAASQKAYLLLGGGGHVYFLNPAGKQVEDRSGESSQEGGRLTGIPENSPV